MMENHANCTNFLGSLRNCVFLSDFLSGVKGVITSYSIHYTKLYEMANAPEIVDIALDIVPDMITLVPEKRKELTTEGGLDVIGNAKKLTKTIGKMRKVGIPVSLFIDPNAEQVQAAVDVGATFVELHTGRYCDAGTEEEQEQEFLLIEQTSELAYESGLRVNAGHGLDYRNTHPIAALPFIEELSIGHAVISRAVMVGLDHVITSYSIHYTKLYETKDYNRWVPLALNQATEAETGKRGKQKRYPSRRETEGETVSSYNFV